MSVSAKVVRGLPVKATAEAALPLALAATSTAPWNVRLVASHEACTYLCLRAVAPTCDRSSSQHRLKRFNIGWGSQRWRNTLSIGTEVGDPCLMPTKGCKVTISRFWHCTFPAHPNATFWTLSSFPRLSLPPAPPNPRYSHAELLSRPPVAPNRLSG